MRQFAAAVAVGLVMSTSPLYAQDAVFVVTMTSAEVHKAPSTGSAVIGTASRGQTFTVKRDLGSWVSVAWPDAEIGVAYLHVAWGRIARGAAADVLRVGGTGSPDASAASGSARSTAAVTTMAVSSPSAGVTQAPRASLRPRASLSLPSHLVGIGGQVGAPGNGVALAGRAWAYRGLGLQIEAGQSTYTSLVTPGQLKSMHLAPSLLYSPPGLVRNAIWVRPYVGAGLNIFRSTLTSTPGVPDAIHNGYGSQVFSGAELTWARLPQLALSADLRQQWAPPTFDGFDLDGLGMSLSAHWYVK